MRVSGSSILLANQLARIIPQSISQNHEIFKNAKQKKPHAVTIVTAQGFYVLPCCFSLSGAQRFCHFHRMQAVPYPQQTKSVMSPRLFHCQNDQHYDWMIAHTPATENQMAHIQRIMETIKVLCAKSPIQNRLSERTRDQVGINREI